MPTGKIAFDHELGRGIITYNETVGRWWFRQAANSVHSYAYHNIANFIQSSISRPPALIVDYACGAGNLLSRLHQRYPYSRLMGLDGSSFLLGLARKRLMRLGHRARQHVRLVETLLPNLDLPPIAADLVVYVFPNMVPCSSEAGGGRWTRCLSANDRAVAWALASRPHPGGISAGDDPETICTDLLRNRLVALNMRRLLKRDGFCMRVEYGNVRREELPDLELLPIEFEEGSLDQKVNGRLADLWFRVVASRYFRSRVIGDVYHQSEDEGDKIGGYFITVLRAL